MRFALPCRLAPWRCSIVWRKASGRAIGSSPAMRESRGRTRIGMSGFRGRRREDEAPARGGPIHAPARVHHAAIGMPWSNERMSGSVLTDAPQLDASARSVIANSESVWFSEASIWELGLPWRQGKIAVPPRRLADQAFANGLRPLPIQMSHCGSLANCGRATAIHSIGCCTPKRAMRVFGCLASIELLRRSAPW